MNKQEIASLVLKLSPVHGPGWLIGPQHKEYRKQIIAALCNTKPKSSMCGITRMMFELYKAFPFTGYTCLADKESKLLALLRETAANK